MRTLLLRPRDVPPSVGTLASGVEPESGALEPDPPELATDPVDDVASLESTPPPSEPLGEPEGSVEPAVPLRPPVFPAPELVGEPEPWPDWPELPDGALVWLPEAPDEMLAP